MAISMVYLLRFTTKNRHESEYGQDDRKKYSETVDARDLEMIFISHRNQPRRNASEAFELRVIERKFSLFLIHSTCAVSVRSEL